MEPLHYLRTGRAEAEEEPAVGHEVEASIFYPA